MGKKFISNLFIFLIALMCIVYPIYILIIQSGFMHWQFTGEPAYMRMIVELGIMFLLSLAGIKKCRLEWIIFILLIFSYLHVMFLPLVISLFYVGLTALVGYYLCFKLQLKMYSDPIPCLIIGMIILTIFYAVLSLCKIGSIRNIVILDVILFTFLILWLFKKKKNKLHDVHEKWKNIRILSRSSYLKLTMIMVFILIAIGRANSSLDYDSVWYGLRSPYVLDNQTGIYDNLKLIGCVYSYSKGYETYMLPLSFFPSYAFVYAGNIVLTVCILFLTYKLCRIYLEKENALWGVLLFAAVPGIMNMSITSKSDIMTLLVQLISIYYLIQYLRKKEKDYLGMVVCTYIYAQTLKPTAVIFSTTVIIVLFFCCLVYRIKPKYGRNSWIITIISLVDLSLIWLRTYWITGIPSTSVWGNVFRLLGFKDKYPYASGQINQFRSELFTNDVIKTTIIRIKEFFLAPNSEDTDHIIIAWGTTLCTFVILILFISGITHIKSLFKHIKGNVDSCCLLLLVTGEFFGCILSLWILSKPDGNYFMLYYAVTIIVGSIYCFGQTIKQWWNRKIFSLAISLIILFNVFVSGSTNWAWCSSFNDINWINRGYYNHIAANKTMLAEKGCKKIYDTMTSNKSNKVLAFAQHPDVEMIPCVIESEQDVNFWGNSQLMSTVENFLDFMAYEDYDYIYIEPGYVKNDSLAFSYLCRLFDEKQIADLKEENGYILLKLGDDFASNNEDMQVKFNTLIGNQSN